MSSNRLFDYQCMPTLKNSVLRTTTSQGAQSTFTIGENSYSELYVDDAGLIHTSSPDGALVTGEIIPSSKVEVYDPDSVNPRRVFNTISW